MDKASFVLYTDYKQHIDLLSIEEKGLLLESIFCYVNGQELPQLSGMAKMAFSFIKSGLDRDAEKYESICDKRRQAANKRWDMQKDANASKSIIRNAMHYDSVSDTGTDSDTDTGTDTDSDNTFKLSTTTSSPSDLEVDSYYQAYCLTKGYKPRDNFTEKFLSYHHGKDWEKDVRAWADQDAKTDDMKIRHTQKKQHNSIQNFKSTDTDYNDIAYQIMEKQEKEMLNHS